MLNKKLSEAECIVSKSFKNLNEDMSREIEVFKKIKDKKPLDKDEQDIISKFKNDIKENEEMIKKELEEIEGINDK